MFKRSKMKYWLAVAAIPVAAFGVAACGDADEDSAQPAVEVAAAEEAQAVAEEAQEQVAELEQELEEQTEQANSEPSQPEPETAPEPEEEPETAPEPEEAEAPDVVGLTLPKAESVLKSAGFKPDASNNDTLFGIVVKANYTVCKQSPPRGSIVPILAQKYGC